MLEKLKIAVLSGGPGSERKISNASAKSVYRALQDLKLNVYLLDIQDENFTLEPNTDLAYIMIHGTYGEDGQIQKKLEALNIPYTGASKIVSERTFDKILSKNNFEKNKISTPPYIILNFDETKQISFYKEKCLEFGLPLVIKPPREGSSVGVHIVKNEDELGNAIDNCFSYSKDLLVEKFITGRELTVGMLDGKALPIVEIIPKDGFYDINNKYPWLTGVGETQYVCPAELPENITQNIQQLAVDSYNSLGIDVYARIDILFDEKNNKSYVLEANTIPGMTESSLLPKSAEHQGIHFVELCKKIAEISYKLRAS